jgi:hypothetical protein
MNKGGEVMKHRQDVLVKCPYYKGEEKQMIFCEGVQEGSAIHLAFDTNPNLKEYKDHFCKGRYNKCLVAEAMNRKWGYDAE